MNDDKLLNAFSRIIDESISNTGIRRKIVRDVEKHLQHQQAFPAKGILATIDKHSDMKVSDSTSALIREIFYHYG